MQGSCDRWCWGKGASPITTHAEDVLYASLTDTDALEALVKIGLDLEAIPTKDLRPMVSWAIDRFFESGRSKAPSREALLAEWAEVLEEEEVELLDEDYEIDNIEWAIDNLTDNAAHHRWQTFLKESATEMAEAPPTKRKETLAKVTNDLFEINNRLQDRSNTARATEGYSERLSAYEKRAAEEKVAMGMMFGLDAIDQWIYGIHPGELGVLAAPPKAGKSYFLLRTALHEWAVRGRDVVLYTLENSVDMTLDRLVCTHLGISPRAWMRGEVTPEKVQWVRDYISDTMPTMPGQLHILMPPPGRRTVQMMVREAQMLGAQSLLIDQLTFVEHPDPRQRPRHEIVMEIMRDLKNTLTTGKEKMACLVAHQINRAGVAAAAKQGYLEMQHLAESSEVERAVDWAFGLYQSREERKAQMAKFQILAARREDLCNWQIAWRIDAGQASVISKIDLEDAA